MDYQGRTINCYRSEMNTKTRTKHCKRTEVDYQGIDCQRRNLGLPGKGEDSQRKRINSLRRSIDHPKGNTDGYGNEENIYSEPVFDDEATCEDHRKPDQNARSLSNQKRNKKSRMKVLETIPPNYVILVPKNSHAGEVIIPCTLVPREMVDNMLHVHREGTEEEIYEETKKTTNYKDDIIEHIPTRNISSHEMNKDNKESYEKDVNDYIEYSSANTGYTEPVYEEHIEHTKYNWALANFISETSLDIRNSPEFRRNHQPKRSSSKVSSFLGSVLSSQVHNKKKVKCRRANTRQAENEYEVFEQDAHRTSKLMDRQLKHNMGVMGL